jgi:hypothetical protein
MAHYAYLDNDNKVVTVTVGKDETELINGLDTETYYAQGTPYVVKRTSYNAKIRGNYAGVGMTYLPLEDIFIHPKCHNEAILNAKSAKWDCANKDHDVKPLAL